VNDTNTAITRSESTITALKDVLDVAAKLLIGIATLCFGIGLVIVNTWLARYSVHSESFVRTEYVLAGGAYVALLLFVAAGFEYCKSGIKYSVRIWKEGHKNKASWLMFAAVAGILGIPVQLIRPLSSGCRTHFQRPRQRIPTRHSGPLRSLL
jgi:hypothetical protein